MLLRGTRGPGSCIVALNEAAERLEVAKRLADEESAVDGIIKVVDDMATPPRASTHVALPSAPCISQNAVGFKVQST